MTATRMFAAERSFLGCQCDEQRLYELVKVGTNLETLLCLWEDHRERNPKGHNQQVGKARASALTVSSHPDDSFCRFVASALAGPISRVLRLPTVRGNNLIHKHQLMGFTFQEDQGFDCKEMVTMRELGVLYWSL